MKHRHLFGRNLILCVFLVFVSWFCISCDSEAKTSSWINHLPPYTQKLIQELKTVVRTTESHSAKHATHNNAAQDNAAQDIEKPLMNELAQLVHKTRTSLIKNITLQQKPAQTAFLLKEILEELYKNPLLEVKKWDLLSPSLKEKMFFAPAFQTVLETHPEAMKKALSVIFHFDQALVSFMRDLTSFVDQDMLRCFAKTKKRELLKLFDNQNGTFVLKQSLKAQLGLANLGLPSLAMLTEIANDFLILGASEIFYQKKPWKDAALWFPFDLKSRRGKIHEPLMKDIALTMYTIYSIRSWFKSPGLATQRFAPWYFLPSTIGKTFPPKGSVFTPAHLPSAELLQQGTLYFRHEELIKNVVHEMFHGILTDSAIDNKASEPFLIKHAALTRVDKGPVLLSEALIESITLLVHTMLVASSLSDPISFKTRLQELWNLEKSFALYQAAKLLWHYGFTSVDEFLQPQRTKKRIVQSTPATEYILFKAALLYEPEEFLALIKTKPHNQQKLLETLLLKNLQNRRFKNDIERFLSWLQKDQNTALSRTGKLVLASVR